MRTHLVDKLRDFHACRRAVRKRWLVNVTDEFYKSKVHSFRTLSVQNVSLYRKPSGGFNNVLVPLGFC